MAAERLAMKTVKRIFELRFQAKLSQRQVAKALGCGRTTIQRYEEKALKSGLTDFNLISSLSEQELLCRLGLKSGFSFLSTPLRKEKHLPNWPDENGILIVSRTSKPVIGGRHLTSGGQKLYL